MLEVYAAGVKKDLGVIEPGKSAKDSITVNEDLGDVHAALRALNERHRQKPSAWMRLTRSLSAASVELLKHQE